MNEIITELMNIRDKDKASFLSSFFKTGKGDYGEGDQFLGIKVPDIRNIAKKYYKDVTIDKIDDLIKSEYHEIRLAGLLILTYKMKKVDGKEQESIYKYYLKRTKYINNWDLVDLTAPHIVGYYLYNYHINRDILYDLANSNDLWKQRIAILSTLYFIKQKDINDTFKIAKILLHHKHDLIHKAVGWMLREAGKINYNEEYLFLKENYMNMPRTMLRYAIERFEEKIRQKFLKGEI